MKDKEGSKGNLKEEIRKYQKSTNSLDQKKLFSELITSFITTYKNPK